MILVLCGATKLSEASLDLKGNKPLRGRTYSMDTRGIGGHEVCGMSSYEVVLADKVAAQLCVRVECIEGQSGILFRKVP